MHGLETCVLTLEDVKLLYIGPLLSVTFLSLQEHTMIYVLGKVFVLFIFLILQDTEPKQERYSLNVE